LSVTLYAHMMLLEHSLCLVVHFYCLFAWYILYCHIFIKKWRWRYSFFQQGWLLSSTFHIPVGVGSPCHPEDGPQCGPISHC